MGLLLWSAVLLAAILSARWGSDKIAIPLQKLRRQWGLTEAAGAAIVALATASPEIGTNAASALQGATDIGLGNLLGSNIISVPAIVTVAYLAAKKKPMPIKTEAITDPRFSLFANNPPSSYFNHSRTLARFATYRRLDYVSSLRILRY